MAPPSSNSPSAGAIPRSHAIDPRKTDAATDKAPKRKLRGRGNPHPDLLATKARLEAKVKQRPGHPTIMLEPAGFDREYIVPLHNDERLHDLQLCEAFGTRSYAVIYTFLSQLEELCAAKWWDEESHQWRMDETAFNTILALIGSLKPRNEMEAAFAAQIAAVHMLNMKVLARASRFDSDARTAATAGKLARTFAMQMDSWRNLRGKNRTAKQSIKVTKETHQHVHYHASPRGEAERGGQPHGPTSGRGGLSAETLDERAALPGPDESGRVVPLPRRSRSA